MNDNIVEVTVKQGDKESTLFQGELDVENESLLVEVNPDYGYGGYGEAAVLDNRRMGDFDFKVFYSQDDLISFIKGITIADGDTIGNKYFMSLELDLDGNKPTWSLHTAMKSSRVRKTPNENR